MTNESDHFDEEIGVVGMTAKSGDEQNRGCSIRLGKKLFLNVRARQSDIPFSTT
jgi:hypothetical protein